MNWTDLKEGMFIKWNPLWSRLPLIILLCSKTADDIFITQLIVGLGYSAFNYDQLLSPKYDKYGYTEMRRYKFENCKNDISLSTIEDKTQIENRLNTHVESYYREYLIQKEWANNILDCANKYYKTEAESEETNVSGI